MGILDYVSAKAVRLKFANDEVDRRTRELSDLRNETPVGDPVAYADHKSRVQRLEVELEGAVAEQSAAQAEADELARKKAIAKDDSSHRAAMKLADEHAKLTVEIEADQIKLAAKADRHAAMTAAIDAANAVRGDRPAILDGEQRVRQRPGRLVPAITEEYRDHCDKDGNRVPDQLYDDENKRWVPNPACKDIANFVRTIREAYQEPPTMPERFASALRLYDLQGRQIWPA